MTDFIATDADGGIFYKIDAVEFCRRVKEGPRNGCVAIVSKWHTAPDGTDIPLAGMVWDFELEEDPEGKLRRSSTKKGAWFPLMNRP